MNLDELQTLSALPKTQRTGASFSVGVKQCIDFSEVSPVHVRKEFDP